MVTTLAEDPIQKQPRPAAEHHRADDLLSRPGQRHRQAAIPIAHVQNTRRDAAGDGEQNQRQTVVKSDDRIDHGRQRPARLAFLEHTYGCRRRRGGADGAKQKPQRDRQPGVLCDQEGDAPHQRSHHHTGRQAFGDQDDRQLAAIAFEDLQVQFAADQESDDAQSEGVERLEGLQHILADQAKTRLANQDADGDIA